MSSSPKTKKLIQALEDAAEGEFRRPLRVSTRNLRKLGFQEGRKAVVNPATLTTVRSAVATATATLIEQFLEEIKKIELRSAEASLRLENELLNSHKLEEGEKSAEGTPFLEPTQTKLDVKLGSRQRSQFKTLGNAAEFLKVFRIEEAKRLKMKFEQDAINERQQERERAAESRLKHLAEILKLKEALAAVEEEKTQAPRMYVQKFLRMISVSEACWAEYCAGYEQGKARISPRLRFNRSEREREREIAEAKAEQPNPSIHLEFERPSIFNFN